jgi:hypothetical protein
MSVSTLLSTFCPNSSCNLDTSFHEEDYNLKYLIELFWRGWGLPSLLHHV